MFFFENMKMLHLLDKGAKREKQSEVSIFYKSRIDKAFSIFDNSFTGKVWNISIVSSNIRGQTATDSQKSAHSKIYNIFHLDFFWRSCTKTMAKLEVSVLAFQETVFVLVNEQTNSTFKNLLSSNKKNFTQIFRVFAWKDSLYITNAKLTACQIIYVYQFLSHSDDLRYLRISPNFARLSCFSELKNPRNLMKIYMSVVIIAGKQEMHSVLAKY